MNEWDSRITAVMLAAQHGVFTPLYHIRIGKPPLCKYLFLLPVKWVNDLFAVNPAVLWKIINALLFYIYRETEKKLRGCVWGVEEEQLLLFKDTDDHPWCQFKHKTQYSMQGTTLFL